MASRAGLTGALILLGVAAAILYKSVDDNGTLWRRPPISAQPRASRTAFADTLARLRDAEKVEDPFQRCVAYPDPPWIHWDHELIVAFCRSRSFQYLGLDEIKAALDARQPEIVDSAFASYLAANFSDPGRHGILTRVYRELFGSDSEQVRDIANRWVALSPRSAFALAARGAYFEVAAGAARGGDYARDTPRENFQSMRVLAAKAESDLREAVRMEPKLTAAYDSMIFVGRMTGNDALVREALQAALAIDAVDERFYLDWMATCEPRWGGSLDAMAEVAREADRHSNANPLLKLLAEKQHAYLGVMEMQHDNYAAALAYFEQAFAFGPSPFDLASAGEAAGKLGQHEKAIWYYSEALRFDRIAPADNLTARSWELKQIGRMDLAADDLKTVASIGSAGQDTLYQQAWAFFAAHDYERAEKTYLTLLKLNPRYQWALIDLSKLYVGLGQRAKAKPYVARLQKFYPTIPKTWFVTAELAEGNEVERKAWGRYLDLVDRNDPDEQADIAYARIRLEKLEPHKG